MKYKIGIMGAHGVGKTTKAYRMLANMKEEHPEKKIVMLHEVARNCPMSINKETTIESQMWIFHSQFKAELQMMHKNDILVCDRTVLDNLAYSVRAGFKHLFTHHFEIAIEWMSTYNELYFMRPNHYLATDGIRDTDINFQKEIDIILNNWVIEKELKVK